MSNHDDLESFGHTFAAQTLVREVKDTAPQFMAGITHSITNTTLLTNDLWTADEFAFEFTFDEDDTRKLAEVYLFDFNDTVYHYDDSEVRRTQTHTLWSMCTSSLRASFFSMPAGRRSPSNRGCRTSTWTYRTWSRVRCSCRWRRVNVLFILWNLAIRGFRQ
jgi:hypothetical protein